MKKIFALLITSFAINYLGAQQPVSRYDESCNCNIITNTDEKGNLTSVHHENLKGKRHGSETVYHSNGTVAYERTWHNGKLHGKGTHYHANGNIYYHEHYDHGAKTGTWDFYTDDGTPVQSITYTGQGNDGEYVFYHNGVAYLKQIIQNGKLKEETVLNPDVLEAVKAEKASSRSSK
ncbi:MAG: hypothetical protein Kow0075_16320 [Salibacteraceae bacterium]